MVEYDLRKRIDALPSDYRRPLRLIGGRAYETSQMRHLLDILDAEQTAIKHAQEGGQAKVTYIDNWDIGVGRLAPSVVNDRLTATHGVWNLLLSAHKDLAYARTATLNNGQVAWGSIVRRETFCALTPAQQEAQLQVYKDQLAQGHSIGVAGTFRLSKAGVRPGENFQLVTLASDTVAVTAGYQTMVDQPRGNEVQRWAENPQSTMYWHFGHLGVGRLQSQIEPGAEAKIPFGEPAIQLLTSWVGTPPL